MFERDSQVLDVGEGDVERGILRRLVPHTVRVQLQRARAPTPTAQRRPNRTVRQPWGRAASVHLEGLHLDERSLVCLLLLAACPLLLGRVDHGVLVVHAG